MKTAELIDDSLDLAVAKGEGKTSNLLRDSHYGVYSPSTNWAQGGPIIEREKIATTYIDEDVWEAVIHDWTSMTSTRKHVGIGPTPLIAAMRCYVTSKLGDEVDVPAELA